MLDLNLETFRMTEDEMNADDEESTSEKEDASQPDSGASSLFAPKEDPELPF